MLPAAGTGTCHTRETWHKGRGRRVNPAVSSVFHCSQDTLQLCLYVAYTWFQWRSSLAPVLSLTLSDSRLGFNKATTHCGLQNSLAGTVWPLQGLCWSEQPYPGSVQAQGSAAWPQARPSGCRAVASSGAESHLQSTALSCTVMLSLLPGCWQQSCSHMLLADGRSPTWNLLSEHFFHSSSQTGKVQS